MQQSPRARARRSRLSVLTAACALLAACGGDEPPPGEPMEVFDIVRDLLADPPAWEVEREHPKQAPKVDVISPALHHSFDGADMIALVLPPPSQVGFTIDADDGPAVLRARVGVDITTFKHLSDAVPTASFQFEVAVNGDVRFSQTITIERGASRVGSSWLDVGGAAGVPVAAGDRVTLRCLARDPEGELVEPGPAAFAGFGGLRLERRLALPRSRSSAASPNLVLIVMDTLRVDRLATYGYSRPTSPRLDELAERGTVFENAYATASWTLPSTASMLTGLHPIEHGVENQGNFFLGWKLSTLAEALQRAGVSTAGWSGNPLISHSRNFSQGFERFEDDIVGFRKTDSFFDEIGAWIDGRGDERFFLYLHLTEPHQPYTPLEEGRAAFAPRAARDIDTGEIERRLEVGEHVDANGVPRLDRAVTEREREDVSDLYDACVWSADHWLGRVSDALERAGLDERTVLVFTSDHGEELFDRGFVGHARSLMSELVRVPLVVAGPGVPAGVRIDAPVSNRLVAPYLAERGGAHLPTPFTARLFDDPGDASVLFSTEKGEWNGKRGLRILGMRTGERVVHVAPDGAPWGSATAAEGGDVHVFDLASDPGERKNLWSESDASLREELERRFGALEPVFEGAELRVGAGTQYLLQRIGYAGE